MKGACAWASVAMAGCALALLGCGKSDVVKKTIGPDGGELTSPDGRLTVTVPPGAVTTNTTFSVQGIAAPAPGTVGPVYDLEPTGTFAAPITLALNYAGLDLGGVDPQTLSWSGYIGGAWAPVPSWANATTQTLSAQTNHFSDWGVEPPHPPSVIPTTISFELDLNNAYGGNFLDLTAIAEDGSTQQWTYADLTQATRSFDPNTGAVIFTYPVTSLTAPLKSVQLNWFPSVGFCGTPIAGAPGCDLDVLTMLVTAGSGHVQTDAGCCLLRGAGNVSGFDCSGEGCDLITLTEGSPTRTVVAGAGCGDQPGVCTSQCDAQSCPRGCCDTQGQCVAFSSQSGTQCGQAGGSCQACPSGQFCTASGQAGGTCSMCSAACPHGCCNQAGQCVKGPVSEQTNQCGSGGSACVACSPGLVCAPAPGPQLGDTSCQCNTLSCTGCCDTLHNLCLTGAALGPFACGAGGNACVQCLTSPNLVCDLTSGSCVACSTTTCPNGCCNINGACVSSARQSDPSCGRAY
jgi:hypothetical protein